MVKKDSKFALSLTYGPRESQLLEDIDEIIKNQDLSVSRNEILRRGLYSFRYLIDVDEAQQMQLLSDILHLLKENFDLNILRFARDTASQIITLLTIKQGIVKAGSFEIILDTLETMLRLASSQKLDDKYKDELKKEITDLATSLDTIFINAEQKNTKMALSILDLLKTKKTRTIKSTDFEKFNTKFLKLLDSDDYKNIHPKVTVNENWFNGNMHWIDDERNFGVLERGTDELLVARLYSNISVLQRFLNIHQ